METKYGSISQFTNLSIENQKGNNKRRLKSKVNSIFLIKIEEEDFVTNWEESVNSFDDLNLKEQVLRGVFGYGFVRPSPI